MVWAWRITCTGSQHWNQQQQKKTTKKKLFFLPKKFSKNIYKYYIGKIILYYTVWIWITTYIFNLIYINKFSFERLYFANLIITVIYIYIQTVLKTEQTTNEKKKWGQSDSNAQPSDLESDALPLRHSPLTMDGWLVDKTTAGWKTDTEIIAIAPLAGLEPAIFGLEVQRVIHYATRARNDFHKKELGITSCIGTQRQKKSWPW